MSETTRLGLPFIEAAQAQKHVTHNEALRLLDSLIHAAILDRDLTTPPNAPQDGDIYLITAGATDAWVGHDGKIATWQNGAWVYQTPLPGQMIWVVDEAALLVFDGNGWLAPFTQVDPATAPIWGVNTNADNYNKLFVKSPSVLFSHDGSDIRQKLNKNALANTASLMFQTNWSGRAEVGLVGDDDFRFKVSGDGSNFVDGIIIDKDSGTVSLPQAPCICLHTAVSQSWGTNASEKITFASERIRQGDIAATAGLDGVTINQAGLYLISLQISTKSSSGTNSDAWSLEVHRNGANIVPQGMSFFCPDGTSAANMEQSHAITFPAVLAANDQIEAHVGSIGSTATFLGASFDAIKLS